MVVLGILLDRAAEHHQSSSYIFNSFIQSIFCLLAVTQNHQDVFEHLDYREKNGYLRYEVDIYFKGLESDNIKNANYKKGVVYIAHEDNVAFLGEASEHEIALQVHRCSGPSGHNRDYVFQLADALQALGDNDEHVISIERILKQLNRKV